jgi:1-hydroxycarotenoid 3,4-desaturase
MSTNNYSLDDKDLSEMQTDRVVIVGAGVGGLAAAVDLARMGIEVVVVEAADRPGGKMRRADIDGIAIDSGPTVFTLRPVFESLFADAGAALADHVELAPLDVLARHAWSETERLDLFVDVERSADAIGDFAGAAEARGYRAFAARAREIFEVLDAPFMQAQRPSPLGLVGNAGWGGLSRLARISPFAVMWDELGRYFRDPRLRQLFGRYATYCGSSPFQAPATLMLVAHAEQAGVWLVKGGMYALGEALADLAARRGAAIRYGSLVTNILVKGGTVSGVRLADGEVIAATIVVCNGDVAALRQGLFGTDVMSATSGTSSGSRSLSAMTWIMWAETSGFPLLHHSVFFSNNYKREFEQIFARGQLPSEPTVYVCAQDRDAHGRKSSAGERLLCLVNAPPTGDGQPLSTSEIESCRDATFRRLEQCGLVVKVDRDGAQMTTPATFNRLYPGTGGALYGRASHGWTASFQRPGSRSRIPGLYLAGGSTHPGPGVPMAAISGRLAARAIVKDLGSMRRSHRMVTLGGTSTR